jgi:inorganic pyrophosphatase
MFDRARPIGLLDMNDHGAYDGKILCVPEADPRQASINSIRQIGASRLEDVAEFFRTYRNLDGRVVTISGWRDVHAVQPLLDSCIKAAN